MTELRTEHLEALDAAIGFLGFSENDLVRKLKELRSLLDGEPVKELRSLLDGEPVKEPDLYVATRQPKRGDGQVWIGWPPQHHEDLARRRSQGWHIGEYYLHPKPSRERGHEAMGALRALVAHAKDNPDNPVAHMLEHCAIGHRVRAILGRRQPMESRVWVDKTGRDPRVQLDELRRAVAEIIGADPDTWPDHGNAGLAIASHVAVENMKRERQTEFGRAWLVVAPGSDLKGCPECGGLALEGQEDCTACGHHPPDDHSWRIAGRTPKKEEQP